MMFASSVSSQIQMKMCCLLTDVKTFFCKPSIVNLLSNSITLFEFLNVCPALYLWVRYQQSCKVCWWHQAFVYRKICRWCFHLCSICYCFQQCQRCAPLYNDKPFRSGDQLQPMNCRPCQCHGHALTCHYDVTADEQPDEHYQGGGGVCDNCMHNTAGTVHAQLANYC